MRVINLAGGPGSGKSTTAAGLFNLMKCAGMRVELVTEVAKDLTYDKSFGLLHNQLLVFANQEHRLHRLVGEVDFAITDSPLYLGMAYADERKYGLWYENMTYSVLRQYDNEFFFINRVKPYATYGRNQTEDQARALDVNILRLTQLYSAGHFTEVDGDETAPITIFERLFPDELEAMRGGLRRG